MKSVTSRKRQVLAAVAICGCVTLIIYLVSFVVPIHLAVQAYFIILVLLVFRYWPPMTRWFGSMPVIHRAIFLVLIGAVIAGHLTIKDRQYFPFVSWEIFSIPRSEDPVCCREFIATTAGGKNVRLLAEQLFPSVIQFNPPDDNNSIAMTHLIDALAAAYGKQHPGDPVRRVDLVQFSVKLHPSPEESDHSATCELLKSYDLSSGRSN